MKTSQELTWRGFVHQTTYKDLSAFDNKPITFYWGVDPSADSMTIGNLAAAMMVKCLMRNGHKAVLLIGGATGLIGDPDGKKQERDQKSIDEIERNKNAIVAQYEHLFEGMPFEVVDNYDWFKDMNYLTFLRDVGKHVPMRQMIGREFVQARLGEGGAGISYAEFSYSLVQGYDFLHLFREKGVTLQVCGSDQWGNSIAGVDLVRRIAGGEAHVYSLPLVVNKATGVKFGKSESGAVWLDANKTAISDFYQFWINLDDEGLAYYFKIYTELSEDEINAIVAEHQTVRGKRSGQIRLAQEVTRLVHGEAAVVFAETVRDFLTGVQHISMAEGDVLEALQQQLPHVSVTLPAQLADVLVSAGLATSKGEASRLLQSGGVYLNGNKTTDANLNAEDFAGNRALLRRGKALKDAAIISLA